MLDNPENKVWLDVDTIVATSDRQAAIRRCREETIEELQQELGIEQEEKKEITSQIKFSQMKLSQF